jgi:hypothetical protein
MSRNLTDFAIASRILRAITTTGAARRENGALFSGITRIGAVIAVFVALATAGAAIAENYHSNPWLLSWIPPTCCVTNDCCWEVSEREVKPVSADSWEVLATGQVLARSAWSPDGKFYRCACDLAEGKWVRHQGANTRCLFVPLRSAALRH